MRLHPAIRPNEKRSTNADASLIGSWRVIVGCLNSLIELVRGQWQRAEGIGNASVARNIRVDLFRPRIDAAGYVRHPWKAG